MNNIINLQSIRKTYNNGRARTAALKSIDLEIDRGEFVALAGPSGSGKSTLLNICGLLDNMDGGEYHFNNESIADYSRNQLAELRKSNIGFVFQSFNLIPVMTVAENIEYPLWLFNQSASIRKRRVAEAIEQVGLGQFVDQRPDQLSGGQRQRVAIARALVKNPQLIIADEPTANLDTETANQVIDLMHQLSDDFNTTFVVATHDDRMINRCRRIVRLQDGVLMNAMQMEGEPEQYMPQEKHAPSYKAIKEMDNEMA